MELVEFGEGRDREFAEMLDEFRAAGELQVYRGLHAAAWEGYDRLRAALARVKAGEIPELVPMDAFFIEEDGRMLGDLYLRHRLSPQLERLGGHIGYKVRPAARNRGVATAALRLALKRARERGIEQALVTCASSNAASARVIEKCGGVRIADAGDERRYTLNTGHGASRTMP